MTMFRMRGRIDIGAQDNEGGKLKEYRNQLGL
jgi:hypothetical protein